MQLAVASDLLDAKWKEWDGKQGGETIKRQITEERKQTEDLPLVQKECSDPPSDKRNRDALDGTADKVVHCKYSPDRWGR